MNSEKRRVEVTNYLNDEILLNYKGGIIKVQENESLTNSGLDSIDTVEVIMKLEEEFDIRISDSETEDLKTFKDLLDLVEEKRN